MAGIEQLHEVISQGREIFTNMLRSVINNDGITMDAYQRFISMQYHATVDTQRGLITAAAHHDFARLRDLRKFLVTMGNEEELHYKLAEKDLQNLDLPMLTMPFDVELYHNYDRYVSVDRPFVAIGLTTAFENMADAGNRPLIRELLNVPFLNENNTTFVVFHMHEQVPHGEQILEVLEKANLSLKQMDDVIEGARKGFVLYLRMAEWAMDNKALSHFADAVAYPLNDIY